jgi:hypothetical protein
MAYYNLNYLEFEIYGIKSILFNYSTRTFKAVYLILAFINAIIITY